MGEFAGMLHKGQCFLQCFCRQCLLQVMHWRPTSIVLFLNAHHVKTSFEHNSHKMEEEFLVHLPWPSRKQLLSARIVTLM